VSVSFSCHCPERKKEEPHKRLWRVISRNCRCSAFDGYRTMSSAYSEVVCLACGATGRTKAGYVRYLPNYDEAERTKLKILRWVP